MADNVPITAGSGTDIATDDAGAGGHVQIIKLAISTDGSATVIPADTTNGLDVDVTRMPATAVEDAAGTDGMTVMMVGGVRRDADTSPVGTDGDVHTLQFNSVGRLKVSNLPAAITATTGTITTSTSTVSADVARASNVMVQIAGTYAGINITFEGSVDGGTTWFIVQAVRSDANTIETTSGVLGSTTRAWELSVNAMTHFRVRATAYTSGTGNITILPGVYATEPVPAAQTHAVTGSGNFAVTMAANATTTPAKARDGAAGATDTGVPAFFVRRDTPTALTPAAGDYEMPQIDSQGSQWVREKPSTTSAITSVAASASSVTVLALNAQRRGATIHNDSSALLYLKLGATASTTSFTVKMSPDAYYEVPAGYTGIIDGIWTSATGSARVTELSS